MMKMVHLKKPGLKKLTIDIEKPLNLRFVNAFLRIALT